VGRIKLAYEFDPHFAVSVSQIDPLPHQLEAVYYYLLPRPQVRFLLADDPGADGTLASDSTTAVGATDTTRARRNVSIWQPVAEATRASVLTCGSAALPCSSFTTVTVASPLLRASSSCDHPRFLRRWINDSG
jgi:hypothetical protein